MNENKQYDLTINIFEDMNTKIRLNQWQIRIEVRCVDEITQLNHQWLELIVENSKVENNIKGTS